VAFKKYSRHTPSTHWSRAQSQKSQPTPCKTRYAFSTHLWVRSYPVSQALDWGLLSKILASMKWAGPRMPKGQLSRVPWPGNTWMPFTFQPALRALSAAPQTSTLTPATYSHSLQLPKCTQLVHHFVNMLMDFFKVPLATSKWHALLVYSGCHHGKM